MSYVETLVKRTLAAVTLAMEVKDLHGLLKAAIEVAMQAQRKACAENWVKEMWMLYQIANPSGTKEDFMSNIKKSPAYATILNAEVQP